MKGLRIIPLFALLIGLTYLGVLFVRYNPEDVSVRFGSSFSPPAALGFVLLTSILVGMVFSGLVFSVELMSLYVQNKRLRRQLSPASAKKNLKLFTRTETETDPSREGERHPGSTGLSS